jgi:hypothetical protein
VSSSARRPDERQHDIITSMLPELDPSTRRWIDFVLRTAA